MDRPEKLTPGWHPSRPALGFPEVTRRFFDFLVEEFGYHVAREELTLVQYETGSTFVRIFHGRLSYEVGVELGRLAKADEVERPYLLRDLIGLVDEEAGWAWAQPHADKRDELEEVLGRESADLREYGTSALRGDAATFDALAALKTRYSARAIARMTALNPPHHKP